MAHYALIDSNNIVVQVITGVDEDVIQTDTDNTQVGGSATAWETFYASLLQNAGLYCLRTSYNTSGNTHSNGGTPLRGNFASVGYKYDPDFDAFIPPQPYPSWKLNYETFLWEPPTAKPQQTSEYDWRWSEVNKEWVKLTF
jgi:hypothetical protein